MLERNRWIMTRRKDSIRLPSRTPAFVDRETGAAELAISPTTWDKWVKEGVLPPPVPGLPEPRWNWVDVQARILGKAQADHSNDIVAAAARFGHGQTKNRNRPA
jgi:hypothetical protein